MYKIFNITYNDGGWHSGDLPNFYYIAESEEDVVANSTKYQEYLDRQKRRGGSVWVKEVSGLPYDFEFENLNDFEIKTIVYKKSNTTDELPYTRIEELNPIVTELMTDWERLVEKAKSYGMDIRFAPNCAETLELYFHDDYPDTILVDKSGIWRKDD